MKGVRKAFWSRSYNHGTVIPLFKLSIWFAFLVMGIFWMMGSLLTMIRSAL